MQFLFAIKNKRFFELLTNTRPYFWDYPRTYFILLEIDSKFSPLC